MKYWYLERIHEFRRKYFTEGVGRAVLYYSNGIPIEDLRKYITTSLITSPPQNITDKNTSEALLEFEQNLRILEERGLITINQNNRILITANGLEYIEHPIIFKVRNHWSFPLVSSVIVTLVGVFVGFFLGRI